MLVAKRMGELGAREKFVHGPPPEQLLFSRGGRFIVSKSERLVKVWTPSGELVCQPEGLQDPIAGQIALLPDGQLLATHAVEREHRVVLRSWDVRDGSRIAEREAPGLLLSAGETVALFLGAKEELILAQLDPLSLQMRFGKSAQLDPRRRVQSILSFDGRFVASSVRVRPDLSDGGEIEIWDAKSGILLRTLAHPQLPSIALQPEGDVIFHDTTHLRSIFGGRAWSLVHRETTHGTIALSVDGKRVAATQSEVLSAFDLPQQLRERRMSRSRKVAENPIGIYAPESDGERFAPGALALDDDGRRAVAGGGDGRIDLFDTIRGESLTDPARSEDAHRGPVASVAFAPNGRFAATGARDGRARIWDLETRRMIFALEHGGNVRALAFSPDGRLLATGADDRSVSLWEAGSGRLLWTELVRTHDVRALAYHPSGAIVLSAGERGPVAVHDAAHGRVLRSFASDPRTELNRALAIHPDGESVAVGGSWLSIFRVSSGAVERHLVAPVDGATRHTALAWSADGARLASGQLDGGSIVLDGKTIAGSFAARGEVSGIALVDEARVLVIGRTDAGQPLSLVDLSSGTMTPVRGHESGVQAVACSADGRMILSGGSDLRALLFQLAEET